jgi:hypothetical protein
VEEASLRLRFGAEANEDAAPARAQNTLILPNQRLLEMHRCANHFEHAANAIVSSTAAFNERRD